MTNAEKQQAYRRRVAGERQTMREQLAAMLAINDETQDALRRIVKETGDKTGEAAVTIRKIATDALEAKS